MRTLEEIIALYRIESYRIFAKNDRDGKVLNRWFLFDSHEKYLSKYLGFFKSLPNLTEVIIYATSGFFKITENGLSFFIQHGHQSEFKDKDGNLRGINPLILQEVTENLAMDIDAISSVQDFSQLIEIVNHNKVRGFGELAVYDTAVRIGAYLDKEPTNVYLHAGAREGCKALETKGYLPVGSSLNNSVEISLLPVPLQEFKALEIEHFFCAAKDKLKDLEPFQLKQ